MTENPLSGKLGLDTTDFKTAIAEMNRDIRVIESGFRASAASLGDWGNSANGLEMRIKALNGEMDAQQKKVAALTAEYKRVVTEKGADSKAAEDLQIKLNKENEALGKMQNELSTTTSDLKNMESGTSKVASEEDKAEKKSISFKEAMGGLGTALKATGAAVAGVAAAVAGIGGAIGKLVLDSAKSADALGELSDKTGISTDKLQEMDYVGKILGTDQDTLVTTLAKLTRNMDAAKKAGSPAADAFKTLGISVLDASGHLRNNQDVMGDALDALGKIPNETERDALAMQLFGKSAEELEPLIKAGSGRIAELAEQAHKVGAVMSGPAVQGLGDLNDTLDSMKSGLQGTLGTLATSFLPGFKSVFSQAQGYLKFFTDTVQVSGGDMNRVAAGVGYLAGQIATDLAAQLPKLLNTGLAILNGIVSSIIKAVPVLMPAVITMINSIVGFITQMLPVIMQAGIQIILALVNGLMPQIPKLLDAALQMIITLANGITQALPQLAPMIGQIIPQIILVLVQNLPLLITAALQLMQALAMGLAVAVPMITAQVPTIIQAFITAFNPTVLAQLGLLAITILMTLGIGLADSTHLQPLVDAAVPAVEAFLNGIIPQMWKIEGIGKNIVEGIWTGIQSMQDWYQKNILDFFQGMIDSVKKTLGIKSPSTVFAGIGQNMAAGLGVGFTNQFGKVANQINGMMGSLSGGDVSISGGAGASGRAGGGGDVIIQNFNDQGAAALGMAMVNERRRARLDASMGV